jgi:predicted HicB family RNase H-like nuclease
MGKLLLGVRIPEELHRRVKAKAALQRRTLGAIVQELLEHWVAEDPPQLEAKPEE